MCELCETLSVFREHRAPRTPLVEENALLRKALLDVHVQAVHGGGDPSSLRRRISVIAMAALELSAIREEQR